MRRPTVWRPPNTCGNPGTVEVSRTPDTPRRANDTPQHDQHGQYDQHEPTHGQNAEVNPELVNR
ncbi:hypothetical protein ACIRPQ_15115 [Streptomyces sp. NPDC101213]|uniref:hypothetical protein n=1 Tax=unclassified Streptomyces TaxID=2593676 RepID=UPI003701A2BD